MPRLMHDRYVAFDDIRGRDLATGEDVRLDALPEERSDQIPSALAELLDDGRDANPRWVALDVRNSAQAAAIARRVAVAGRMRGFVPILVSMYAQFRERLAEDSETNVGINVGGGVKVSLAGPLRLRFDYRVFSLQGDARHSKPQRFYAGVNLKF